MKESNIDYLLRKVSNCDTEAGKRLRYHLTRSRCSEEYAKALDFSTRPNWLKPTDDYEPQLTSLFVFDQSSEGHVYWYRIYTLIEINQQRSLV